MEFVKTSHKAYKVVWIRKEFLKMCEAYRKARARMRRKMNSCVKCSHKFEDGEMMGLACFEGIGNRVICGPCVDELQAQTN